MSEYEISLNTKSHNYVPNVNQLEWSLKVTWHWSIESFSRQHFSQQYYLYRSSKRQIPTINEAEHCYFQLTDKNSIYHINYVTPSTSSQPSDLFSNSRQKYYHSNFHHNSTNSKGSISNRFTIHISLTDYSELTNLMSLGWWPPPLQGLGLSNKIRAGIRGVILS